MKPVCYSITYNGEHCRNVYDYKESAQKAMQEMNQKYPDGVRAVVPLCDADKANARIEELEKFNRDMYLALKKIFLKSRCGVATNIAADFVL